MPESAPAPLLVGTVTLDFLHHGPLGAAVPPVTLRWGGVINNVACTLGARGVEPVLVTANYTGELRASVAGHLTANRVVWRPLPVRVPLPFFQARLEDGSVADMRFLGQEALDLLTPRLLASRSELLDRAAVVVAGTDAHMQTLSWLRDAAASRGVPFWLLSADPTEVHKLHPDGRRADFVALNLRELSGWAGEQLPTERRIAAAARRLVAPGGGCLVTLGRKGSLLITPDDPVPVRQDAVETGRDGVVTVGAGDVLFGCLLAERLAGRGWRTALSRATALTSSFLAEAGQEQPYASLRDPAVTADLSPGEPIPRL